MSSYAESVLSDGERIIYRASVSHWVFFMSYLVGGGLVIGALAAIVTMHNYDNTTLLLAAIPAVVGLLLIFSAVIRKQTTELVLTDRRIIMKRGLVARNTVEMNLSKVESLHVNQGLMGRFLDYGDVTVVGTGSSLEPLRGISSPIELRRKLGDVHASATKNPT